jgi:hypothetical protein
MDAGGAASLPSAHFRASQRTRHPFSLKSMKTFRPLVFLLALAAIALPASAADKSGSLPIDQALKIAMDYLQQHGAAANHQIIGITMEAAALGSRYWYAHWSPAIDDNGKKQVGMRIDMDGTATLFVTGSSPAGSGGTGGGYDKPIGQRPQGARNMR